MTRFALIAASVFAATAALADGGNDPAVASRARLQVGKSAEHIGQEAIQMHGGIGVTAEYPVSHYVARLTAIGQTLGGALEHRRELADRIGMTRQTIAAVLESLTQLTPKAVLRGHLRQ